MRAEDSKARQRPILFALLVAVFGYVAMLQFTRDTLWAASMEVETGGIAMWYIDTGNGFSEREGSYKGVPGGVLTEVQIFLPSGTPRRIRFDPVNTESVISIGEIRWDEPWPGGSGELSLDEAEWVNVESVEKDSAGRTVLHPLPGSSDVYAVWSDVPTHSIFWWRGVRLLGALILGSGAFAFGTLWNRKIMCRAGQEASGNEAVSIAR